MTKDYFVGIGAQKAGTTWLAEYFTKHPQVGFSPIKELHYFDAKYRNDMCSRFNSKMRNQLIKHVSRLGDTPSLAQLEKIRCLALRLEMVIDEKKYIDYFDSISSDEHRVVGEITPAYSLMDKTGFSAIKRLYKNAKFLFIMRDPVDRYWSQLRYRETRKGEDRFCAAENVIECLSDPSFFLRADYKRTLTELYKATPREDVCVVFFEHLMNPATHECELSKITDFLNIDYIKGDLLSKIRVSKSVGLSEKHVHRVISRFHHVYEYVNENFSEDMPKKWRERLLAI